MFSKDTERDYHRSFYIGQVDVNLSSYYCIYSLHIVFFVCVC